MKRNKMLKFNAQVATIKLAQCDLQLKGACSKYEHDADRQRRRHLKEVNQLQYDFRIMQVIINISANNSSSSRPTWLWGRYGRHNSTPASSVVDFSFCRPDSSHDVSVQYIHLCFGLPLLSEAIPSPVFVF